MAGSVNTNINSLAAVQALTDISNSLTKTQANIQSGFKVNTASDNPAIFTVAQGLRANIGALGAVKDTLATNVATLEGQTAGAKSISDTLKSVLTTVTQSAGQSGTALAASVDSVTKALANINSFVAASTINGVNLLDGVNGTLNVLSNVNGTATTVTITGAVDTLGLGLDTLTGFMNGSAGAGSDTATAINNVNAAITEIGQALSALGAGSTQLKGLVEFTGKLSDAVTTSLGAMVDANLSEESAKLSSLQTKQSLAIQSLSLANQGPGSLLQLFR